MIGDSDLVRKDRTSLYRPAFFVVKKVARRLSGTEITANCFHPGLVATGFNRNNGALMRVAMVLTSRFARTPAKGAETLVWLAAAPELDQQTGGYYFDCRRVAPSVAAQDAEAARRLWDVSEKQLEWPKP